MILKVDGKIPREILERLIKKLEEDLNVEVYPTVGKDFTILGLVGDTSVIDIKHVAVTNGQRLNLAHGHHVPQD